MSDMMMNILNDILHNNIEVKLDKSKYEGYTEDGKIKNVINKVKEYY